MTNTLHLDVMDCDPQRGDCNEKNRRQAAWHEARGVRALYRRRFAGIAAIGMFACALSGCSVGPPTMERDRLDYQTALAESWKRQILLNLVRIRYADAPVFLEVTSIINQYSTEGRLNAGITLNGPVWSYEDQFGASATYSDKPTITYMPLTGEKFARSLLAPLPPATLVSLVQWGWPVDAVVQLTCSSLNGIRNQSRAPGVNRPPDPRFDELLTALRQVQINSTIATRIEKRGAAETAFIIIGREGSDQSQADICRVLELLGLDPNIREFRLVYGAVSNGKTELAMQTRSMSQLLTELAGCIDVPPEHVAGQKTFPTTRDERVPSFIRIHTSACRPANAFAKVHYRGHWFWVDDGDFASKRMLSLILLFFSLVETGGGAGAPVVTVNAG